MSHVNPFLPAHLFSYQAKPSNCFQQEVASVSTYSVVKWASLRTSLKVCCRCFVVQLYYAPTMSYLSNSAQQGTGLICQVRFYACQLPIWLTLPALVPKDWMQWRFLRISNNRWWQRNAPVSLFPNCRPICVAVHRWCGLRGLASFAATRLKWLRVLGHRVEFSRVAVSLQV